MNKSSGKELAFHLAVFLERVALKYFRSLDIKVQSSYKLAKQSLHSRFLADTTQSSLALDHCEKSPLEGFESFGYRVKELVDRSYPGFGVPQREVLYLQNFLRKIDPELAEMLAAHEEAKTIDQAIAICIKKQNAKERYGAKTLNVVQPTGEDAIHKLSTEIENLKLKIEDLTKVREYEVDAIETRRPRNVQIYPLKCFFCNKIGHIKRDCINYQRSRQSGNRRGMISLFTYFHNDDKLPVISVNINSISIQGTLDTGSSTSLISLF
ncbi:hypothetical protein RF11_03531 [Thelohanellus kitauei]|uniref:CCHC-type domain-containing protein n=2 Tax=Thelohanellus kitauei TaxID=669202 RepID=A0A0C2MQX8_THEKT|nr:hypothetical protein RF11_03531 [Thelohanellus kitauei]